MSDERGYTLVELLAGMDVTLVVLGAIVNTMFTVTDAILIETSHSVMRRLKSSEALVRAFQRVGGGILVALGLNLALARA